MRAGLQRFLTLGIALLLAGCTAAPTTYDLRGVDKDAFGYDLAACGKEKNSYIFTYENPFDTATPIEKCLKDRGYTLARPH